MRWILGFFVLSCLATSTRLSSAQQSNPYDGVANPYLLLVREPSVWEELKLSSSQRQQLATINYKVDGPLLAMRNWSADAANKKFAELLTETERGAGRILSREQQTRIRQIGLRIRGIECVLDESVAESLQLSTQQRETIQGIVQETRATAKQLREQVAAGKPREPLEREYRQLQADEQKRILAEFTAKQREQLTTLVGRTFDLGRLGKISFRAPEFIEGGEWLNSPPLSLAKLRGQVVAVHIWTYG